VLEPLSGYLWLGAKLLSDPAGAAGEAFNFGPKDNVVRSVRELVDSFLKYRGAGSWKHVPQVGGKKESVLLKLCCDKALQGLSWRPVLDFEETVRLTAEWYENYYSKEDNFDFSCSQIQYYVGKAREKGAVWGQ
jgi:CDP-glucose 4,6-dehydratase